MRISAALVSLPTCGIRIIRPSILPLLSLLSLLSLSPILPLNAIQSLSSPRSICGSMPRVASGGDIGGVTAGGGGRGGIGGGTGGGGEGWTCLTGGFCVVGVSVWCWWLICTLLVLTLHHWVTFAHFGGTLECPWDLKCRLNHSDSLKAQLRWFFIWIQT